MRRLWLFSRISTSAMRSKSDLPNCMSELLSACCGMRFLPPAAGLWAHAASIAAHSKISMAFRFIALLQGSMQRGDMPDEGSVSAWFSNLEQRVHFRGTDEVVFRQAVDGVGGVFHLATVVGDGEIGVMVFAVRHPGDGVHEGDGLVVILEVVGLADQVAVLLPAFQLFHDVLLNEFEGGGLANARCALRQADANRKNWSTADRG